MNHTKPFRLAVVLAILFVAACGGQDPADPAAASGHPLLGERPEAGPDAGETFGGVIRRVAAGDAPATGLTVDYPLDESIFPPDFVAPTFLWHDAADGVDTWLVTIAFATGEPLHVLVPGSPRREPVYDPMAFGETNEPYLGSEYQRSARTWTPTAPLWEQIRTRSVEATATVSFTGFAAAKPARPVTRGEVRITTSRDPVGAPIFYRDVPLMPGAGREGKIQPLDPAATDLIAWRLRDLSKPESRVVLRSMPACGNCHSFSRDGKTLGMDVDGPHGDKGMYALTDIEPDLVIGTDDVLTWNSFSGKPEGHTTIGFLSRVSPDGRTVVSTVNEALYVQNFLDYRFLQVFYPTRGILAFYSRDDGEIRPLPGADDPAYVHCAAVWTPDGRDLVFCRATACDPEPPDGKMPEYSNDPNELPMKYDLYRIPFDGGKGGTPEPIEGASANGMSNSFPKVSPDGKWLVWVKCRNGQLMRPDGRLWIVPLEGGEARQMRCNMETMNSWHSFSPNGRWMVFTSKTHTPYTQAFLTHIDEDGNDSPAILIPNSTADNRAVNLPEFLNAPAESLQTISVPAVNHHAHFVAAERLMLESKFEEAIAYLERTFETDPLFVRAHHSLGVCLAQIGKHEEALAHFVFAREHMRDNPLALYNVGVTSLNLGRSRDAIDAFRLLKKEHADYPQIDERIRAADEQMFRLEATIERCRQDVRKNPADGKLRGTFSDLLANAGRRRESLEHLEKAVKLAPDDVALLRRLAWVLATNRDPALRNGPLAVAVAGRALAAEKGRPVYLLEVMAAALAAAGRYEDAVRTAEESLTQAKKKSGLYASLVQWRLEHYREGKPWRQPPVR
ncbi:MAG: tetratricopeptide repeat protein [Planctomycetota bacterium]